MRVLVLADARFAVNEQAMLSRLEVGLVDEGVRVIHAVPRSVASWAHAEVFTRQVTFDDRGSPFSRMWRIANLARSIDRLESDGSSEVNIIHAFGEGAWPVGRGLASMLKSLLVLEVWRPETVALAVTHRLIGSKDVAYFTPEQALERALHDAGVNGPVRTVPWGVHAKPSPMPILSPGRSKGIVLLASGRDRGAIERALEGIARSADMLGEFMVFSSSAAIDVSGLWSRIGRLGLRDRVTLIEDLEARRDPALEGDIAIFPETYGEQRSFMLDAMARGMLVIAGEDEGLGVLREGRTARLVSRATGVDGWAEALRWAINRPDDARALGASAWEFVRSQRKASAHVAGVLNAYEWLVSGETLSFKKGVATRD
jgi:glycosyltransferase involved in cell wall biosynthesis